MKYYLILLLFVFSSLIPAQSCQELMRPFLTNEIQTLNYEKLFAQCMSPNKNEYQNLAQKKLKNVFIGMSAATTIVGYTQQSWEKPKDKEWFARLGYTLTFGVISGAIYNKLIIDQGSRFQYLVNDYLFGRVAIITFSAGSALIFSNDKENLKKINKLKNSKSFNEDMLALQKYTKDKRVIERFKNELISHLSNGSDINLGIGVHQGVDFDHLNPNDLNDPEIQKVVIAAILRMEYDQHLGPIATGSPNTDFFIYDSMYSLAKIPKDILVNKLTNQVMCLNLNNPARGYAQAIGINTLNQIIFADYYGITYTVLKKELTGR